MHNLERVYFLGGKKMNVQSFNGVVTRIDDFPTGVNPNDDGCYKLFSVNGGNGQIVNFVVEPTTYFVEHTMINVGDRVTGFYDGNAPAVMIYPPQYRALVIAKESTNYFVTVDHFNRQLMSQNHDLQLMIGPQTVVVLENGQRFTGSLANRDLIVLYGPTTRSIPAQTTPYQVVVMC